MKCTPTTRNPSSNYNRLTDPETQNKYEGMEPSQIDVHEYRKLEDVKENEHNTPEKQNTYVEIDKTRCITHKYTKLGEMKRAEYDTFKKWNKYEKIDQIEADGHKYAKVEDIDLDIPESQNNYDEINEEQIVVDHYMEITQIEELKLNK